MIVAVAKQQRGESLDAFAASLEPQMRAAILGGIEALRAGVNMSDLEEALASGSPYGVELALGLDRLPDLLADVRGVILDAVRGGGDIAAAEMGLPIARKQQRRVGVAGAFRFDITDPDVLNYVRDHSGALIAEITETTRAGIRDLIAEEYRIGRTPKQTARIIRGRIGLTQAQERIAQNYERTLRAAVRGEASWSDVNRFTLNPIRGAGGMVESRVETAVGTYRQRLLNMRADTIARTETFAAAGAGRQEMWKQMQARGALPPGTEREWSAAFDACQICQDLNGKRATIDGTYPGGFKGPPAHPNCRCSEGLTFKPKPGVLPEVPAETPLFQPPDVLPFVDPLTAVLEVDSSLATEAGRRFADSSRRTLEQLPGVAEAFQKAGTKVKVGETVLDMVPELRGVRPRGWSLGSTWDQAEGLYQRGSKQVVVSRTMKVGSNYVSTSRAAGVMRHEVGHGLDDIYGFRENEAIKVAYRADVAAQSAADARHLSYYRQSYYGDDHAGRSEAVAEGYGVLRGGGADVNYPNAFKRAFPKFLDVLGKELAKNGL